MLGSALRGEGTGMTTSLLEIIDGSKCARIGEN